VLVLAAFTVTGSPLRNDNAGRFALSIEANVLGTLPGIGGLARRVLLGSGPERALIARLFVRHAILLPLALLALVVLAHAFRILVPAREGERPSLRSGFSAPNLSDLWAVLACTLVVLSVAGVRGAPLGAPADLGGMFPARPVWYFQPLYLLRQALPAEHAPLLTLLGVGAAVGLIAYSLRRAPGGRGLSRRVAVFGVAFGYALLCAVGVVKDLRDRELRAAALAERWTVARVETLSRAGVSFESGARHALNADPLQRARAVFGEHCANCHQLGDLGPRDGVSRAPTLDGFGRRTWVLAMLERPDAPDRFGNTPFAGQMPSVVHPPADPALSATFRAMPELERAAVADFLQAEAFADAEVTPANRELGARIVRERCTSCHRFSGKTDDDESAAPELQGWASPAWISAQILNPRSGRTYRAGAQQKGRMPSFGGVLTPYEVALLVDLLRGTLVATSGLPDASEVHATARALP
jgi:ubiquinol-cytochrome c reductase cytochrome b subunit